MSKLNGKLLNSYLLLTGLQKAYLESESEGEVHVAQELKESIELLNHLASENEILKKKIYELESRLKAINWSFGGIT